MRSKRIVVGIALAAVALVGGACGGGKPEASVQSAGAPKEQQRGLQRPESGYYLTTSANLSVAELDAITLRFYGTTTPGAGADDPEYRQAVDDAAFEKANSLRDEAEGAGFDAIVVANPGGKSGCFQVKGLFRNEWGVAVAVRGVSIHH